MLSQSIPGSEVDLGSGEVRIVNTKWHKSRSIVMSEDMRAVVRSYAAMAASSLCPIYACRYGSREWMSMPLSSQRLRFAVAN